MPGDNRGYLLDLAGLRFVLSNDGIGGEDVEHPQMAALRFIGFPSVAPNSELGTIDVTAGATDEGSPDPQDTFPLDYDYAGTAGSPTSGQYRVVGSSLRISAVSKEAGNQGLALLARMSRGGFVRGERVGAPLDNIEFKVGPPTNVGTYLSFPILDQFSTTNVTDMTKVVPEAFALALPSTGVQGGHIDPSGHHMLVVHSSGDQIMQWYLSTPFDIRTAVLVHVESTNAFDGTPADACWGHDGTYVVWVGAASGLVRVHICGSAWGMKGGADSTNSVAAVAGVVSVRISSDGRKLYTGSSTTIERRDFPPGGQGDLSVVGAVAESVTMTTALGIDDFGRFFFSPDDLTMYALVVDNGVQNITRLALASAGVITGVAEAQRGTFDLLTIDLQNRGLYGSPDGQFFLVNGNSNQQVYRYHTHALAAATYRLAFLPQGDGWQQSATIATNEGDTLGGTTTGDDWLFLFENAAPRMAASRSRVYKWTLEWGFADGYGGSVRLVRAGTFIVASDSDGDVATFYWKTEEQPKYASGGVINFEVQPEAVLLAADHGDAGTGDLRVGVTFQDYASAAIAGPAFLNLQLVSDNPA